MAVSACREKLDSIERRQFDHPGLALQRYLAAYGDGKEKLEVEALLNGAASSGAGEAYRAAFKRWNGMVAARPGCAAFVGALSGPLAVGLGAESPLEAGLTTQHAYGMPVIPGSALKGLCRRAAGAWEDEGRMATAEFEALFGTTDAASHFVFWDAWYDPDSCGGKPFKRDVVTVHHPRYYGSGGDVWPTDFDDPNPIPFLVVKPAARFLFAVDGPGEEWRDFVARLLRWGLERLGAGGKTNAGYGGFAPDEWAEVPRPPIEEVWRRCRLDRSGGGSPEVTIVGGPEPLVLRAATWQPIQQREVTGGRLEAVKSRPSRLYADVRVKREARAVEFIGFDRYEIEGD